MSKLVRSLAAGTAISVALATGAHAQQAQNRGPNPSEVFSAANIVGGVMRVMVGYARFVADVRYGSMQVDPSQGSLLLRDLDLASILGNDECYASLGQLQITGFTFWGAEDMQSRLGLSDLKIATNCFGPNAAMIGVVTGGPEITLQSLSMDSYQQFGSGKTVLNIDAISPGIARVQGSADLDYFSLYGADLVRELSRGYPDDDEYYDPYATPSVGVRATLRSAHLSVEDLGIWERVQPMLPPSALTREEIEANLVVDEPGTALHGFQTDLADAVMNFIEEPGQITIEIRPDTPLELDGTEATDPDELLALLDPQVSNAAPTPPVSLIADPADESDPLSLGMAFAEGQGVPKNTARAIDLLSGVDDPAAVLKLAELTAETDPEAAYADALRAAGMGAEGALSVLDRIELMLPLGELISLQDAADANLPEEVFASAAALSDAAAEFERGETRARSYALAYRLASSAAAAGDMSARALMGLLESRFGGDPAWPELRDAASEQAIEDWSDMDLAARFAGAGE